MPIPLLTLIELSPDRHAMLREAGFEPLIALGREERERAIAGPGAAARAVLTNGITGLTAAEMDRLPALEIISTLGVGYEGVDVPAARARGITVTHGPGTNDSSVADHTMALMLAVIRNIPQADASVRRGEWNRAYRPAVSGKRLGILGLGRIGEMIARRGAGGFDMPIGYHTRTPREGSPYTYFPSPAALAAWSDILVVATPGGAATRHLVNATVLDALGAEGFLVNIGRGSVVDTAALIEALHRNRIAGAALDVVEGEPVLPPGLAELTNVVLTPHLAGRSPESFRATIEFVIANLSAHFAGRPVLTPVPAPG
jgi:lactate dehydrogenase-like 2-hydroxyacid dehydrogenase